MRGSLTRRELLAAGSMVVLAGCSGHASDEAGSEASTVIEEPSASEPESDPVDEAIASLTFEQKAALLFVVRPESLTGEETQTAADDAMLEALAVAPPAGICWFAQNLEGPEQTEAMLAGCSDRAREANGLTLLNAVDEEGGIVARVASNEAFGVTDVGSMQDIGAAGDARAAEDAAAYVGGYLTDLGFDVDFAPVCDVVSEGANAALKRRSFGEDPELVAEMVSAQVRGYLSAGVLCSAKHFPGIGYAEGDSETEAIYSTRTLDEMRSCELVPFEAAVEAGVPLVMVGHLVCEGASDSGLPASLDPAVIQGVLRDELGFDRVVITDSLGMGALANVAEPERLPLLAFEAGADLLLMPADYQASLAVMLDAISDGTVSEERLNESLRRIVSLKL